MPNKLKYVIDEKNDGNKLIHFLKMDLKMSSRFTKKMARNGLASINGKRGMNSTVLRTGDIVEIIIAGEETQDIAAENIPINVVYEDEDLLIVNKPPFMVVHPTKSHQEGTLANGVVNYFMETGQDCIVRLVNRLDRDTSGLVIIAKSQFAHQQMANMLINNSIEKYYIAMVEGKLEGESTIDLSIGRPFIESIKREVMEEGQRAVTHFEVLQSSDNITCVNIKLETGRTHQIRVHLSHIGHPLLGDTLYGTESEHITRQALHAYKLKFEGIRNNKLIEVTVDLPEDMKKILNIIQAEASKEPNMCKAHNQK
jgi:23S rRNA pseudouridine1911/1915/1917 synthase